MVEPKHLVAGVALVAVLAALAVPADAAPGTAKGLMSGPAAPIRLGVENLGFLSGFEDAPAASSSGATNTGIRYLGTGDNMEGISSFAGWGLSWNSLSPSSKWSCSGDGNTLHGNCVGPRGPQHLYMTTSGGTPATPSNAEWRGTLPCCSVPAELQVTSTYAPSASDALYAMEFHFANVGSTPISDIWYRGGMALAPEPRPSGASPTFITIDRPAGDDIPDSVRATGRALRPNVNYDPRRPVTDYDGASCAGGPSNGPGSLTPSDTWFTRQGGNCFQAIMADLDLGHLAPGADRKFTQFYGAAASTPEIVAALTTVNADFWFLWESSTTGEGPVYAWGFAGLAAPSANPTWCQVLPAGTWTPARWSCTTPCAGRPTPFVSGAAASPPHTVTGVSWDWGDSSSPSSGATATHTYASPGTYALTVTVTDENGWVGTATRNINVVDCTRPPPPNVCPTIQPMDDWFLLAEQAFTTGIAATDGDHDWAGNPTPDPLSYTVTIVPSPSNPPRIESTTLSWQPAEGESGTFTFTVAARDEACSQPTSFRVRVYPAGHTTLDQDRDGVADTQDNCPAVQNRNQEDWDLDGIGDACNDKRPTDDLAAATTVTATPDDLDADGIHNSTDNCPAIPNEAQLDLDLDQVGDACDADTDGDGIAQGALEFPDNCATTPNTDQLDVDGDEIGDACDGEVLVRQTGAPTTERAAAGPATDSDARLPAAMWAGAAAIGGILLALLIIRRSR